MKRIVILCDGTWNRAEMADPTNVVRLAHALAPVDSDGVVQVPIYVPGVGTGRGVTRVARLADRVLGGAFGWGLMDNVVDAYRHLVFLHDPGDAVFIFGFSRGAFTARSLTGLIRSTGIIDRDRLHLLPEAVARYQRRGDPSTHPGSDESHDFRARMSFRVATSEAEVARRVAEGWPATPVIDLAYLGVWDTVGALGVPSHLALAPLLNRRKYEFHDADLSRLVRSARHAIALDERRRSFSPTRWRNVADLNAGATGDDAPYQERFFAGDHGSVGGGGDIVALSNIALDWVMEGAARAGLAFDAGEVAAIRRRQDPTGPLHNFSHPRRSLIERAMRLFPADREGPETVEEVHPSVLARWAASGEGDPPYRPGSLRRVRGQLAGLYGDGADSGVA